MRCPQADQQDAGDKEFNSCFVEGIPLPQGNFRAQQDSFNEGKIIRILADSLVKGVPTGQDIDLGFLQWDQDFFVSQIIY